MKTTWIIAGALCLAGCASKPESAPENTVVAPIAPPPVATAPPVVVTPPMPNLTPPPSETPAFDANTATPATSEPSSATVEEKQRKMASLRSDMSRLQDQRRNVEEEKRQFGERNPNASPGERALGSNFPDDVQMARYNLRLDQIDSDMSATQKQIDDLMLGG